MDDYHHFVYVEGELKYQLLESIWYDTASPAQACIKILKDIKTHIPNVRITSSGKEYPIDSEEIFRFWAKHVFSPTGTSYECDFSAYL